MNLVLSDNGLHLKFAPLTLTRPLGELRMGMFTFSERWSFLLSHKEEVLYQTENPFIKEERNSNTSEDDLVVNAAVIPSYELADEIKQLASNETLVFQNTWIAKKGKGSIQKLSISDPLCVLENRWDLYLLNEKVLKADFEFYTNSKQSQQLSSTNTVIGDKDLIFLEEGARIEACILNTTNGPIYLGKNSEVMEGSMIRGPFSLHKGAGVKMGAKIYGGTSIGPYCKVGGEISNCIFLAYSNKGHDGFLGNSYVSAWCNLGADTNSSNLKNNYSPVKTYDFESESMHQTDVTFMGLFMGDHSKCSINTMFNTATVVGVSANIFSSGFPKKYVPSFVWGENDKFKFEKALEVAEAMMKRRGISLSDSEIDILKRIYDWGK
jgi:UDP-N-acetylglucosamine diphosphorylase/glucosamine-1-phosphate N-acetyltransferase